MTFPTRTKIANILRNFHRNSPYPEAGNDDVDAALDAIFRVHPSVLPPLESEIQVLRGDATPEEFGNAAAANIAVFSKLLGVANCPQTSLDEAFIADFASWNLATFGPGLRTEGTVQHIRKELDEILADPTDTKEWVDVLILALNGLVRLGLSPAEIIAAVKAKHEVNKARKWPDWRNHPDTPIEHDRSGEK